MLRGKEITALAAALTLGACAVAPPTGPTVMALPAKDKSFEAFQQDDMTCRQYAAVQTGGVSPTEAANQSAISSAAIGTVLGAAAGAAIGAAAGNPAMGAAIGAGSGLFLGGASGVGAAGYSATALQQRYDMAYVQCMYAKGESVPTETSGPVAAVGGYPYAGYTYPYPYGYPYGPYPYYPGYYYPPVSVGFVAFGGGHFHHH